jgi:hypothetical protein
MSTPSITAQPKVQKAFDTGNTFFLKLQYLEGFNINFVQEAVGALANLSLDEACFVTLYRRAVLNVRSILRMDNATHFQAVVMVARAIFETSVDLRLADWVPNSAEKMEVYERLEKLRAAQKATGFASTHTVQSPVNLKPYQDFINHHAVAIEADAVRVLGSAKAKHWSGFDDLQARVDRLKGAFQETYHLLYKQFSWHTHPGLAGVNNMGPEGPPTLYGIACEIGARGFEEILRAITSKLNLSFRTPTILKELEFAVNRAGADGDQQLEAAMRRTLGLI